MGRVWKWRKGGLGWGSGEPAWGASIDNLSSNRRSHTQQVSQSSLIDFGALWMWEGILWEAMGNGGIRGWLECELWWDGVVGGVRMGAGRGLGTLATSNPGGQAIGVITLGYPGDESSWGTG